MLELDPIDAVPVPSPAPGFELSRHTVPLSGLPREANGVTIAQVSDTHRHGGDVDALLTDAVERINALRPDFVVLTGDFVERRVADVLPVARILAGLRPRRGTFAVVGNHDYTADACLMRSALSGFGCEVLDNRAVEALPGLWIAGTDDVHSGSPDLAAALRQVPTGAATVVLSHNPRAFTQVPADRELLMLSGHTHGGQFDFLFFPAAWVCWVHLRTRYVHGWYRRGNSRLYVNRGLGTAGSWPLRRRVRCEPEVSVFHLVAGSE
ncbi:MAG TPA: metallophosphoesterase [Chthonomonadales bacterium]|nr:metallophosphoesterase [Chthonomonadales bacterium]